MNTQRILFLLFLFFTTIIGTAFSQKLFQPYNLDFENGEEGKMPPGWSLPSYSSKAGYTASLTTQNPNNGKYCFELRRQESLNDTMYGSVMQSLDAAPYRGKTVRFRAAVRAEISSPKGSAHLWIRVRLPKEQVGFFDLMEDQPVVINTWKFYEITGKIDEDAETVNFGLLLFGSGKAWIDDASFRIDVMDSSAVRPPAPLTAEAVENLCAFTKLFGFIKYYCASSESISTDWDRFALTGTEAVEKCENSAKLIDNLKKLFIPIAPAVKIYQNNKKPSKRNNFSKPPEALENIALAWMHVGPKTGVESKLLPSKPVNVYQSQRDHEGSAVQILNLTNMEGKEIEFSTYAKADVIKPSGQAQLWLRIDDASEKAIYTGTMFDKPITENKWKQYSIKATIPKDAKLIRIGLVLIGEGQAWFDECKVKISSGDTVKEIDLKNPGFEEGISGELVRGWRFAPLSEKAGYSAKIIRISPYKGKSSLEISSDKRTRIFLPEVGESFSYKLNDEISFEMPLTLFVDSTNTLPHPPTDIAELKCPKPENFEYTAKDRTSRLATIVTLWNVFRQFSLYQNNDTIWDIALKESLTKAATDKDEADFLETLKILVSKLDDSQARVWSGDEQQTYGLPFLWKWVEGKLVISDIAKNFKDLQPGDIITEIEGKPTIDYLTDAENTISAATPQWKRIRALAEIRAGGSSSKLKLKVITQSGKEFEKEFERSIHLSELSEMRPPELASVNNDIIYLDLTRIKDKELKGIIDTLKSAKAIIFDLRGISLSSEHFLGFFTDHNLKSLEWEIPVFTFPNKKIVSKKFITSEIKGRNKLTGKKLAFLADEHSTGYSETILTIVKNNGLGEIVGTPTAGTAGEIMPVRIPGGFSSTMTVIRVNQPDGKELYGEGVQPTVPAPYTLESIKKGRDPAFDKAAEVLSR